MTNLFHAIGMILLAILAILDIITRGTPITWSNFTVINVSMIISIGLYILDVATKGKYGIKPLRLILITAGLVAGIIYSLSFSIF